MSYDDCFDDLVPVSTVRFVLDGVRVRADKPVALTLKHAGESNPGYFNARARLDAQLKASTGEPTSDAMRPLLIPIFAKHVIADWENVNGTDGKATKYSARECEELLSALARKRPDIVDRVMVFAMRPDNFTAQLDASAVGNE